jgi:hypothetical protein
MVDPFFDSMSAPAAAPEIVHSLSTLLAHVCCGRPSPGKRPFARLHQLAGLRSPPTHRRLHVVPPLIPDNRYANGALDSMHIYASCLLSRARPRPPRPPAN